MKKTINILTISDQQETQESIGKILKDPSHNLIFTGTKKKAMAIIKKQKIGIIIVDLALKRIDTNAFVRSLRLLRSLKGTYTLILSNNTVHADKIVSILRDGAIDYISYPFNNALIKAKVNTFKELYFKQQMVHDLLENILPKDIIEDFEAGKKTVPKKFNHCTILFIDIVGFTKITKEMKPYEVVNQLDYYFHKFDEIIKRHGLEKIKTIGDAYMAVSGVPEKDLNHAVKAVAAAYAIKVFIDNEKTIRASMKQDFWEVRIGLHSGPLIAGIVGEHKFSYDVWGDSVNTAKRIESNSEASQINISLTTQKQVNQYFECIHRGDYKIKHGGEIGMFFVKGIRKEYQADYSKHKPGKELRQLMGLQEMDFIGFRTEVVNRLKIELSDDLLYHDLEHTLDVEKAAHTIGTIEGVSEEEMILLRSAALIHDAGFILRYDDNEELGFQIMYDLLTKYGFNQKQIELVHNLVGATKSHYKPQNLLEEIIRDADHDYLGRSDYYKKAQKLHDELISKGVEMSEKQWIERQIDYLENQHRYFTNSSINRRGTIKSLRVEELKRKLRKAD